jgi:hypothetical protein
MNWLDEGPDGWTRRYIAGLPFLVGIVLVLILLLLRPR